MSIIDSASMQSAQIFFHAPLVPVEPHAPLVPMASSGRYLWQLTVGRGPPLVVVGVGVDHVLGPTESPPPPPPLHNPHILLHLLLQRATRGKSKQKRLW